MYNITKFKKNTQQKMAIKNTIIKKARGESSAERITAFCKEYAAINKALEKAKTKEEKAEQLKKQNSIISTFKRALRKKYQAVNTLKFVFTNARNELLKLDIFHHSYSERKARHLAKYPDSAKAFTGSTSREVKLNLAKYAKNMTNKRCGEYTAIKKIKVAPQAFYSLALNDGEQATITEANRDKKFHSKNEKLNIWQKAVKESVLKGLNSKGIFMNALALSLCIGRRPVELFLTASFKKVDNKSVIFSGQAKDKGTGVRDNYKIPVMHATADEFLKVFEIFRERLKKNKYEKLTPLQLNRRISSEVSKVAREMLKNKMAKFYTCRSIYAEYAYKEEKEKNINTDKQIYLASILGHDAKDMTTAQSYEKVTIIDTDEYIEENITVIRKKPVGVAEVEQIQEEKRKTKEEAKAKTKNKNKRIEKFKKGAEIHKINTLGVGVSRLHEKVINLLKEEPEATLTQTFLYKKFRTSIPVIKKYIKLVENWEPQANAQ